MSGHLAYAAALVHTDDLRREAAAERLAATGRGRRRRRLAFTRDRTTVGARPARDPAAKDASLPFSRLRAIARH